VEAHTLVGKFGSEKDARDAARELKALFAEHAREVDGSPLGDA